MRLGERPGTTPVSPLGPGSVGCGKESSLLLGGGREARRWSRQCMEEMGMAGDGFECPALRGAALCNWRP